MYCPGKKGSQINKKAEGVVEYIKRKKMLIIPAIDLRGGKCVRLWQGRKDRQSIYSHDPLSVAKLWKEKGARRLHIVDLDGAFEGRPVNLKLVERISKELNIPVELGGGIRDLPTLKEIFERGIDYAILGSKALSLKFMEKACQKFGDKIIVSIDVRDGKVAIEGWEKQTDIQAKDLAKDLTEVGVRTMIFTDITRDGTMRGVNIKAVRDFVESVDVDVIVSGGISSLEDVKKVFKLNNPRIKGTVIGKALYTGMIRLEEAMKIVKSEE